jgi:PPE-repeat protein
MQFPTLPPEINTLRMLSGAGSGPMLQAAQAWQSLGNSLRSASSSFQNVTSNLAGGAWQGAAAQAMAQAAAPYVAWLTAAATHSETACHDGAAAVDLGQSEQFYLGDTSEYFWTAHPGDHGP